MCLNFVILALSGEEGKPLLKKTKDDKIDDRSVDQWSRPGT